MPEWALYFNLRMSVIYQGLWFLSDEESNKSRLIEYVKLRGLGDCTNEEVEEAILLWNSTAWKYYNDFPPKPPRFLDLIIAARAELKRRAERKSMKVLASPPSEIEIKLQKGVLAAQRLKAENPEKSWAEISRMLSQESYQENRI